MSVQRYDFGNSIGYIINRTAKAFAKALDSQLREKVGVTVGQWKVLVMLVDQNGLTQKEIAYRLGLEGATLIPIIDKMEKDKLVVRKVDPTDRRNNMIYRTEMADVLWDKMIQCALNVKEISLKSIPDENVKIMKDVLESIWQNLRLNFDVDCTSIKNNQNLASSITTAKKRLSKEVSNENGNRQRKRY
ncbi:MAG TPA: MarR family winged helix-turn-helix transcriptional regulator [Candidatus Nitrosopolaris sp.]|nr:MarR family winged helix-turn-helix transcriptional regulator [Candidatus Nitrosopolaris sp.]